MASASMECEVCDEAFNSDNRKPLCLTCGHTFCYSCIARLLNVSAPKNCPKCRKKILQRINQVPVVYALIPSENKVGQSDVRSQSEAPCTQHKKALDYLCMDCMELTCFRCIGGTHAAHRIESLDDLLQEDEAVDARTKVRTTLLGKLENASNVVSISDGLLGLVEDLIILKTDLEGQKDSLLAQKVSAEQDLHAWDASVTGFDKTKKKKRQECRAILSRLKLKPEKIQKIPEFKALFDAASMKCDSLECNGGGSAVQRPRRQRQ
ncbi:E3 ubiquitin-protein ligase TRIM39 [Hyalella azteca]|uniref:E3 ubiquitin-protein ligase TRIM39 n=1 Tax=Hyalella azteca TaxID=294128 RepID=A0A8B7NY11_HYAAZ|nr:E3 ubiquitin-protein ligase TRIM39 [Hyalella azteca]